MRTIRRARSEPLELSKEATIMVVEQVVEEFPVAMRIVFGFIAVVMLVAFGAAAGMIIYLAHLP